MGRPRSKPLVKDKINKKVWKDIVGQDPSLEIYGSVPWQDVTSGAAFVENVSVYRQTTDTEEKEKRKNWRRIQEVCWHKYKTYGPLNSAINRQADFVTGEGFDVYSVVPEINEYIYELMTSYRNKLYASAAGWVIRMLTEGELFLILVINEEGRITVRALETARVGEGNDDDGLITHPLDVGNTLFYKYKVGNNDPEFIPDVSIMLNPEVLDEAKKASKDFANDYNKTYKPQSVKSQPKGSGSGRFAKLGGYNRFILHWKNLSGIHEYKRDVAALSAVIEAVELYWNAIKWGLDHKKAQTAYTNVIGFEETPAGKLAYHIWKKMTDEEKKKTGLMSQLTPGSTVFLLPGMTLEIKSPNISKLSGDNEDILHVAGSGLRMPHDLWQGNTKGGSYSSVKSTRAPLVFDSKSLQKKFRGFFIFEFLRACLHVAVNFGHCKDAYPVKIVQEIESGKPNITEIPAEPVRHVGMTFPIVDIIGDPHDRVNASLGSKHAGLKSIGVSRRGVAASVGIHDIDRQARESAIEDEVYGRLASGPEAETAAEEQFKDTGGEGGEGATPEEEEE